MQINKFSPSKSPIRNNWTKALSKQKGISLVVVLVMLGLLALVGLGAMQMNVLQEKGAGNARDESLAFQAAESTLRDAELYVDTNLTPTSSFSADCTGGLCLPSKTSTQVWDDPTLDVWNHPTLTIAYSKTVPNVAKQPAYIIELLAQGVPNIAGSALDVGGSPPSTQATYRITTRTWGGTSSAQVTLQSVYLK